MAGRSSINKAVAVALLALLFAAGEAAADECKVDQRTVLMRCTSACSGGGDEPKPTKECCASLANADYDCLCRKYREEFQGHRCAQAIPYKCYPEKAPKSCPHAK